MKTSSLNAYVRFSIILMELNALKALFMSFQMIQDFRLTRELSCMTIAGTDFVVRNIRRFPGFKNFPGNSNIKIVERPDKHEIFWTINFDAAT